MRGGTSNPLDQDQIGVGASLRTCRAFPAAQCGVAIKNVAALRLDRRTRERLVLLKRLFVTNADMGDEKAFGAWWFSGLFGLEVIIGNIVGIVPKESRFSLVEILVTNTDSNFDTKFSKKVENFVREKSFPTSNLKQLKRSSSICLDDHRSVPRQCYIK